MESGKEGGGEGGREAKSKDMYMCTSSRPWACSQAPVPSPHSSAASLRHRQSERV